MSSSTSTPTAVLPPPKTANPPRKFPLPCWTHDETVALIEAYRERWISLRRGYLRTVDWEAVASTVASKCEHVVSSTKSSDQCRHKIEKLRQRYRAEKQRCVAAFPGKFSSGWIFFKDLSFLDDGGSAAAEGKKRVLEEKSGVNDPVADVSSGDLDDGFLLTALGDRKFTIDLKNSVKTDEKIQSYYRNIPYPVENIPARRLRNFSRADIPPSLLKENQCLNGDNEFHGNINIMRSEKLVTPAGYATVSGGRNMIFDVENKNFNYSGGASGKLHSSTGNSKIIKNRLQEDSCDAKNPLAKMAESIKQMGEDFLKMEKTRMEIALQFEKARMEMDIKRNEMIIESHKRIADAFMNVAERKKSKK